MNKWYSKRYEIMRNPDNALQIEVQIKHECAVQAYYYINILYFAQFIAK